MFTKMTEWERNRHEYAQDWQKRTGGKVMGYFCTYVPEEILYAAGVLPVRILGSHEPQDRCHGAMTRAADIEAPVPFATITHT